ncbi:tyrosine-type recombinase/integrase [Arthrobacter sp. GCM10027362]|uniref:tyrosine-type recombinase/integrase n=1 Tax=Arthrobacter sp. GCM10027362 TaxID=3273379 RepID=UPI00362BD5F6
MSALNLPDVGKVVQPSNGIPPWDLVLPDSEATSACRSFLRDVHSRLADLTVRSYALDLQRWFRFLFAIRVEWDKATPLEVTDFFIWMKHAKKSNGNQNKRKRDPRISRNAITGKRYLDDSFSQSTISRNETVLFLFYEFQRRNGAVLNNPVNRGRSDGGRANAHRNPLQGRKRKSSNRHGNGTKRLPRSMPDDLFDEFFQALGNDRDRALVAMYVSSGARPAEILGLDVGDIDLPKGIVTVTRKGGNGQDLPISWDAVAWYRIYQGSASSFAPSDPAWKTVRGEPRRLTYEALRAMFRRANKKNGTNWTAHDLRHTTATRMLAQGTPERTVQEVLGHATLETLKVYTVPHFDDMVAAVRSTRGDASAPIEPPSALPYDPDDLDILFGR